MSLYNNVNERIGVINRIKGAVDDVIDGAGNLISGALGGGAFGDAVGGRIALGAQNAINRSLNEHLPYGMRSGLDTTSNVIQNLVDGDFDAAALEILGYFSSTAQRNAGRQVPTPMLNGMSLDQAQRLYGQVSQAGHVRKNLFILEVQSAAEGNMSEVFNMFAVDVDFEPFNIAADKQRLGGAVLDLVSGQEAVDLRLTTYDNDRGELKRFFARHHAAMSARDGTVGVPADYALKVRVLHGVVKGVAGEGMAYVDSGLFRVTTVSNNLSRRESLMQELQVTLSQLDSFMRA